MLHLSTHQQQSPAPPHSMTRSDISSLLMESPSKAGSKYQNRPPAGWGCAVSKPASYQKDSRTTMNRKHGKNENFRRTGRVSQRESDANHVSSALSVLRQELAQMKQAINIKTEVVDLLEKVMKVNSPATHMRGPEEASQSAVRPSYLTSRLDHEPAHKMRTSFANVTSDESLASQATDGHPRGARTKIYRRENAVSNLKYKTSLCRHFEQKGECPLEDDCQFAHGAAQLRPIQSHPLYKTRLCRIFMEKHTCPYGERCYFYHSETERQAVLMSREIGALMNTANSVREILETGDLGTATATPQRNMADHDVPPTTGLDTSPSTEAANRLMPLLCHSMLPSYITNFQDGQPTDFKRKFSTMTPFVEMESWNDSRLLELEKRIFLQSLDSANTSLNDSSSGRTAGSMPSTCTSAESGVHSQHQAV